MKRRNLKPDPVDFQIIRTSNCCQLVAGCCQLVACIISLIDNNAGQVARYAAWSTQCVADCFTSSVGGCMCVQINEELDVHMMEHGGPVANAVPVGKAEMER